MKYLHNVCFSVQVAELTKVWAQKWTDIQRIIEVCNIYH